MTLANVLLGMAIGFPMMIAVGPISVLLLDQGLQRGIRVAAPAAFGVASADLSLSIVASVAGTTVSAVLAPISTWLTIAAVAVLAWLAVDLARSALGGLRAAPPTAVLPAVVPPTEVPAVEVPHEHRSMVGVGSGAPIAHHGASSPAHGLGAAERAGPGVTADAGAGEVGARSSSFGHLAGARLAVAFYGLTMVNPLTLVLFASVVVAGGTGIGTAGWAAGMALASLLAHGGFVVLGGAVRTTLGPGASARLRLGAAVFMGALALHFVVGL